MSTQYDDMMGDPQPAHMGSQSQTGTQVAGDVVNLGDVKKLDKPKPMPTSPSGWPAGVGSWAEGSFSAKVIPLKPGQ